jgi:hypothetical protein
MYDFYFGTKEEIAANESKYLLFIKRMLPRWCNSIPDSEYLAIHNCLALGPSRDGKPVLVETGVGASTIVLLNHAMKFGGVLYSWDTNPSKGSFLRSVCTETLGWHYGKNLFDHWKFIAANSLSEYVGLDILRELGAAVDFCFFDSEHTRHVLLGELSRVNGVLRDHAIVAIDDANYSYVHTNIAYLNMLRKKLNLTSVQDPAGNRCDPFFIEVERFLRDGWATVEALPDTYKQDYQRDLFWAYYEADREAMSKEGLEKVEALEHRFDAWRVSGRKSGRSRE